jgi:hypothetical protein
MHLNVNNASLYNRCSLIDNHPNAFNVGDIWSYLGTPVINRAAQFWINWIFLMLLSDVLDIAYYTRVQVKPDILKNSK